MELTRRKILAGALALPVAITIRPAIAGPSGIDLLRQEMARVGASHRDGFFGGYSSWLVRHPTKPHRSLVATTRNDIDLSEQEIGERVAHWLSAPINDRFTYYIRRDKWVDGYCYVNGEDGA